MKSKYETHVQPHLDKIAVWAGEGATAKAIAEKLKVSYSTFRSYLDLGEQGDERYSALSAAFAYACAGPDDEVEHALFDRARGMTYEEKTFETKWNDREKAFEEICIKRVTRFLPPDPTSVMFWLTNRRPDRWRYKPEAGGAEDGGGVILLAPVDEGLLSPEGGGDDG